MYEVVPAVKRGFLAIGLALLATVAAIWLKFSLTDSALLPGIDGAYYWVQARSILETGSLAFDDLPLLFLIQAGLGGLLGDIPLAVRITDAVLPALSAIPIFFMLRNSKAFWVPALAIAAVLINPIQLYFFTGNFIKNAATIPLVFAIGYVVMQWEVWSKKKSVIWLLSLVGLLALTHFGVLLLGALFLGVWLLMQLRNRPLKFWMIGGALAIAASAVVLLLLAMFVPDRFERLIELVSTPLSLFSDPSWQAIFNMRAEASTAFAIISGQLGALVLIVIGYFAKSNLKYSDRSILVSAVMSTALLSSPFIAQEWSNRLAALAFVPLAIGLILLAIRVEGVIWKALIGIFALGGIVVAGLNYSVGASSMLMNDEQYEEFKKFAQEVELPENSVVVASHGMEFLVAWEMRVNVIESGYYAEADVSKYDAVYSLESAFGIGSMHGGPAGPGDGQFDPNNANGFTPQDGQEPPQRPEGGDFTPPNGAAPGDRPAGLGEAPSGDQPVFGGESLNLTGETVYESENFTLVKVTNP